MIGARIKIIKGLKIPPVKYNNSDNCDISNIKNKNVFVLLKVELSFWIKYEKKFINIDNKTTNKHSIIAIGKFNTKKIINNVISWPNIANHLILIKFVNNTVFNVILIN